MWFNMFFIDVTCGLICVLIFSVSVFSHLLSAVNKEYNTIHVTNCNTSNWHSAPLEYYSIFSVILFSSGKTTH